jgi:uncharacterized protein
VPSEDLNPQDLFACTLCGDCCKGYGGTYVSSEDIAAIAAFLHLDPSEVVRRYCRMSGGKYLLGQGPDGYCLFWQRLCTIHRVKPPMCRRWPFIESVVRDPRNWLIMAGSCPGMRSDIPLRQVRACVQRVLASDEAKCHDE